MPGQAFTAGQQITDPDLSVYRRIPNKPNYYAHAKNRPSGLNFLPDSEEEDVSMWLTHMTAPEKMLDGLPGFGLCEIRLAVLINLGLRITYEPNEGEGHVSVWGLKDSPDSLRRVIAKQAATVRKPDPSAA